MGQAGDWLRLQLQGAQADRFTSEHARGVCQLRVTPQRMCHGLGRCVDMGQGAERTAWAQFCQRGVQPQDCGNASQDGCRENQVRLGFVLVLVFLSVRVRVRVRVCSSDFGSGRSRRCGDDHTLVLMRTGLVYCFGGNGHGQLGLDDIVDRGLPCLIPQLKDEKVGRPL